MKEKDTEVKDGRQAPAAVILSLVSLLFASISFGLAIYITLDAQHRQERTTTTHNDGFHDWVRKTELAEFKKTIYTDLVNLKREHNRLKAYVIEIEMKSERQLRFMRAILSSKSGQVPTTITPHHVDTGLNQTTTFFRQRRAANDPTTGEGFNSQCIQGPPGRDGRDGRDGQPGPPGVNGITTDDLQKVLSTFQESMLQVQKTKTDVKYHNGTEGGAVYTRWGRTTCPQMSKLLYKGVAAGSDHGHSGGGSEKLCLPHDPQWGKYQDGFQSLSYIYGAEYEINGAKVFSRKNANDANLWQHDVPCAVCHTPSRASQLMIPAWRECPATWTKEYSGYLMAEYYNHHRSSFDCVDEAPEVIPGGSTDQNGALFYHVEAKCGSLPCPNYVDGRELTCVVCTK